MILSFNILLDELICGDVNYSTAFLVCHSYSKEEECKRVFYIEGLMRCKLTPDDSKLVISTSRGYLLIVHDLDLSHLDVDMEVFKSLETSNRLDPLTSVVANFNSLFDRPKNRLEIINDFPEDDKAEIIASLEVSTTGLWLCQLLPVEHTLCFSSICFLPIFLSP